MQHALNKHAAKEGKRVGRPKTDKQYRQNLIRVSSVEDWITELIEKVPDRSRAKALLVEELEVFLNKENEKYSNRKKR